MLFAVIAVRLLFDPQTYAYYTSGLVLAAVLVDLFVARSRFPIYSCSAVVAVYALRATPLDYAALGEIRATYCITALASLFLPWHKSVDRTRLRLAPRAAAVAVGLAAERVQPQARDLAHGWPIVGVPAVERTELEHEFLELCSRIGSGRGR